MNSYSLKEIALAMGGEFHGKDMQVDSFSIDSREIKKDDLFIALKGENYDAHNYIKQVESEASCIVCSKEYEWKKLSCNKIIVDNTLSALQEFSKFNRNNCDSIFIAVTGSNGKTTVKEMIVSILSKYKISYTKGNLNNHIGVPLTLLSCNENHDFAIIEIGSNSLGEIKALSSLVSPHIGVVTNIGHAHLEGFKRIENTVEEKSSIYQSIIENGTSIINRDDKFFDSMKEKIKNKYISFGYNDCDIKVVKSSKNNCVLSILGEELDLKTQFSGDHNSLNAACAAAVCYALNIGIDGIKQGLEKFSPVKSRLNILTLHDNITLIDDCYNANPNSFRAAIDFLSEYKKDKWIIIGDMAELGNNSIEMHKEVGQYAKTHSIDKVISYGKHSKYASQEYNSHSPHFSNLNDLYLYLDSNLHANICLLIKGSRNMKLENVVEYIKTKGI